MQTLITIEWIVVNPPFQFPETLIALFMRPEAKHPNQDTELPFVRLIHCILNLSDVFKITWSDTNYLFPFLRLPPVCRMVSRVWCAWVSYS